jgi:hypothetical protein
MPLSAPPLSRTGASWLNGDSSLTPRKVVTADHIVCDNHTYHALDSESCLRTPLDAVLPVPILLNWRRIGLR